MTRTNDYSDYQKAQELVSDIEETVQKWARTANPHLDDDGVLREIETDADNALTYHYHAWLIIHNFNLENEESETVSDGSLNDMAAAIAYEFLVEKGMDEWERVQNARENGDVFWCNNCDEWHDTDYMCEVCDEDICPKLVVKNGVHVFCDDCREEHTCEVCSTVNTDVEYSNGHALRLCADCLTKQDEFDAERTRERDAEAEAESRFERE